MEAIFSLKCLIVEEEEVSAGAAISSNSTTRGQHGEGVSVATRQGEHGDGVGIDSMLLRIHTGVADRNRLFIRVFGVLNV